jgi:hypothetical protein
MVVVWLVVVGAMWCLLVHLAAQLVGGAWKTSALLDGVGKWCQSRRKVTGQTSGCVRVSGMARGKESLVFVECAGATRHAHRTGGRHMSSCLLSAAGADTC